MKWIPDNGIEFMVEEVDGILTCVSFNDKTGESEGRIPQELFEEKINEIKEMNTTENLAQKEAEELAERESSL